MACCVYFVYFVYVYFVYFVYFVCDYYIGKIKVT